MKRSILLLLALLLAACGGGGDEQTSDTPALHDTVVAVHSPQVRP